MSIHIDSDGVLCITEEKVRELLQPLTIDTEYVIDRFGWGKHNNLTNEDVVVLALDDVIYCIKVHLDNNDIKTYVEENYVKDNGYCHEW
jgi:hypothetical protein